MHKRLLLVNARRNKQKVMKHNKGFGIPCLKKKKKKEEGSGIQRELEELLFRDWICCSIHLFIF